MDRDALIQMARDHGAKFMDELLTEAIDDAATNHGCGVRVTYYKALDTPDQETARVRTRVDMTPDQTVPVGEYATTHTWVTL